MCIMLHFH